MIQDTVAVLMSDPTGFDARTTVAAIAVAATVVTQLITLVVTNRRSKETIRNAQDQVFAAIENGRRQTEAALSVTKAQLVAGQLQQISDRLYDDLAEYLANSYHVDVGYRGFLIMGRDWPGEYVPQIEKEDLLYNKVRLRLNPASDEEKQLLGRLDELRDTKAAVDVGDLWIERRDRVIEAAHLVNAARWGEVSKILDRANNANRGGTNGPRGLQESESSDGWAGFSTRGR